MTSFLKEFAAESGWARQNRGSSSRKATQESQYTHLWKSVALREQLQLQGSIILTVAASQSSLLYGSNNKCFKVKRTHRVVARCLHRKTNEPTAPWRSLLKKTARKLAKQLSVTKAKPPPLWCHLGLCTSTVPVDLPLS